MSYKEILKKIEDVVRYSQLSSEKQDEFAKRLKKIRSRVNDDNLYIGIVGEFSSGKSTLINSLIGADFFETSSLQGTTTVITKLHWGNKVDMIFNYKDGSSLSYRAKKRKILLKYLSDEYARLSSFQKLTILLKDIFHLNGDDEFFMQIFDLTTTSNEISDTLDDVSVYYPSKILRNGVVIVDTPGTDSLIPKHAQITQHAIKDICDTSIIVIPTTKPFSESLADYIEDNIGENVSKCVFFITKIELLRKSAERTMMINGISQRISNFLKLHNPTILMAPTLLSLEEKGIVEKTEALQHLHEDERNELCANYDRDLEQFVADITSKKGAIIHSTIKNYLTEISSRINKELEAKKHERANELDTLRRLQTIPLADFMVNFFKQEEYSANYTYLEAKLQNTCRSQCNVFKDYIVNQVDMSSSKDEAQGVMEEECVIQSGQEVFAHCYDVFMEELLELKTFYEDGFSEFQKAFKEQFAIDPIDFVYSLKTKDSWQKKYNLNFNKEGLTTFKLFRVFKSLQSIKAQMKEVILPKIENCFEKMSTSYLKRLKLVYSELDKQMNVVKQKFVKEYDKIIQRRIKEEKAKEIQLLAEIQQLETSAKNVGAISESVTQMK